MTQLITPRSAILSSPCHIRPHLPVRLLINPELEQQCTDKLHALIRRLAVLNDDIGCDLPSIESSRVHWYQDWEHDKHTSRVGVGSVRLCKGLLSE